MTVPTTLPRFGLLLLLFAGPALLLAHQGALYGDPHLVPLPPPAFPDHGPKDPPVPVVKLRVRVPACTPPGKAIEYRICVENCSPAEAHHVVVKNPVPANAKFVKADPEPARLLPELQWHLGTIGGGATREICLTLMPTDNEEVKNCSRVQFEHGQCVVTRPSAFPGTVLPPGVVPPGVLPVPPKGVPPVTTPPEKKGAGAGQAPPVVSAEDAPKLTLAITGHKQQYINLPSRYFLTVTNPGKARATNVLVTAALPDKAQFVHASDDGQFLERQVAWFLGNLDPGQRRTVELVLKATAAGEWCVKATARADRNVLEQAEACTQFLGASALTVDMVDREDPVVVGDRTSYPILIRNQGSAAVTNIRVRALLPPPVRLERTQPPEGQPEKQGPEGQWVVLPAVPTLDPGGQATFEIFVQAAAVAESRLEIQVFADQLERGPVTEQENTTIFADDRAPPRPAAPGR